MLNGIVIRLEEVLLLDVVEDRKEILDLLGGINREL